jgi:hypothetical protein
MLGGRPLPAAGEGVWPCCACATDGSAAASTAEVLPSSIERRLAEPASVERRSVIMTSLGN